MIEDHNLINKTVVGWRSRQSTRIGTNVLCNGASTASVDLTVNGGTTPYSFAWSNSATSEDLTSIPVGIYSVTATDANGCITNVAATVTQPSQLVVNSSNTNLVCFGGNNATISLTVSGAVAPYSYTWSNNATTKDLTGLTAGVYTVAITDGNGCLTNKSITVSQPNQITIPAVVSNITCHNKNNGGIDVTVTNAVAPYKFVWNGVIAKYSDNDEDDENQKDEHKEEYKDCDKDNNHSRHIRCRLRTEDLKNLKAGIYTITVLDANACSNSNSFTVVNPDKIKATVTVTNPTCYTATNGKLTAVVTGGTPGFTYSWNTSPVQTSAIASGLNKGNFTVSVSDINGCSTKASGSLAPVATTDLVTYTAESWASTSGKNAAAYLMANFSRIGTIVVGNGTKTLTLTSATAVRNFLPSGGNATALNGNYSDPGSRLNNSFAGQIVALTLNVKFDAVISTFAPSSNNLGTQVMATGTFAGMSVNQLLTLANQALGGVTTGYSINDINSAVSKINKLYTGDDNDNSSLLYNACNVVGKNDISNTSNVTVIETAITNISLSCYPNPASTDLTIRFGMDYTSMVNVELFNIRGELVTTIYSDVLDANQQREFTINAAELNAGAYFCKITSEKGTKIQKIIIAN